MIQRGLRELQHDERDFKMGAICDLPELSELPSDLIIGEPVIKDQRNSDFCGRFSSDSLSEIQENVELCPEWGFAATKEMTGDKDEWGLSLRDVCKGQVKIGALPQAYAPFTLKDKASDWLRDIDNWPRGLKEKAYPHRKKSYFKIEANGNMDLFDTIRAYMYALKDKKCGVLIGVDWSWDIQDVFMKTIGSGFGHAMAVIGWKTIDGKPWLYVQNSAGLKAGESGRHYFSRDVINSMVSKYGAFMFLDLERDVVETYIESNVKIHDNVLVGLFKIIFTYIGVAFEQLKLIFR